MNTSEVFGVEPEKRTFAGHDALVLQQCLMGVEVEVEGAEVMRDAVPDFWIVGDDPSLRNNGVECKFEMPLCGADLVKALRDFEMYFVGLDVNHPLYRTSTHIHLDVRDTELQTLRNIVLSYIAVERVLIRNIAPERGEHHIFSLPFYKATGDEQALAFLFHEDYGFIREGPRKANKYSAMNIKTLMYQNGGGPVPRGDGNAPRNMRHGAVGSLEFRFFPSTTKAGEILEWINLIQCLKSFAERHQEWVPGEFSQKISEMGMEHFLAIVFGDMRAQDLKYDGYANDLLEGVRCAQDIVYNMREPEQWANDVLLPKCRDSKKDKTTQPFTRYKRKHNKKEVV